MSVWKISAGSSKVKHTAAFPEAIVERIVTHWSQPGDVVFDPFVGSGTTVRVAQQYGRLGLGGDISHEFMVAASQVEEATQMRMI